MCLQLHLAVFCLFVCFLLNWLRALHLITWSLALSLWNMCFLKFGSSHLFTCICRVFMSYQVPIIHKWVGFHPYLRIVQSKEKRTSKSTRKVLHNWCMTMSLILTAQYGLDITVWACLYIISFNHDNKLANRGYKPHFRRWGNWV